MEPDGQGKRKLCVVTGTRAEFGLLYWLMREIRDDPELVLQVVATGMHLSPEFGSTYRVIEQEGFHIDERVEMLLSADTAEAIAKSIGLGVIGFADAFRRLAPDVAVVLGDRFEIFAAAQAAMIARIPLAHIHGGEATEGLIDEPIRHSITKMAQLHFTAAEPYRRRVIQLGEDPDRVFNVGAPALDNIARLKLQPREELEASLGLTLRQTNFLVTYHPVTLEQGTAEASVQELLAALDEFTDAAIVFTKPNADTDGRIISAMIDSYAARHRGRVAAHTSLGQVRYLSAMKHVEVVIGNSSSGLIEAPALGKPTVNIGDRQRGRLRSPSVIDCPPGRRRISDAIREAISPRFTALARKAESPYGKAGASGQMKTVLKTAKLDGIVLKRFHDLP